MNGETDIDFTDDEIRDELSKLGYGNVPHHRFEEFKSGLYLFYSVIWHLAILQENATIRTIFALIKLNVRTCKYSYWHIFPSVFKKIYSEINK